jgi:hypothetical protein
VLREEFTVPPEDLDRELDTLAAERPATPRAADAGPREFPDSVPRVGGLATASLLVRMGAWSVVLPVLKRVLPLPSLVRLMSGKGSGGRSHAREEQVVLSARRVYRLRRPGSCLERSLLVYRYLSSTNAEPRLVIGVRRDGSDMIGHAWVLVDGSPLYESSASLEPFLSVVEFAPDGHISSRP